MSQADRTAQAARLAAQLELDPDELDAAAIAVWSSLNPQATPYITALSVAAAALRAVRHTRRTA